MFVLSALIETAGEKWRERETEGITRFISESVLRTSFLARANNQPKKKKKNNVKKKKKVISSTHFSYPAFFPFLQTSHATTLCLHKT